MTTFEKLIANNNWELNTPFIVHGVRVTDEHLAVWIAADNPNQTINESGDLDTIEIEEPSPNFFVGNTEGVAEEDDSISDEEVVETVAVDTVEETVTEN